jgi:NADPH2:quinone reductase
MRAVWLREFGGPEVLTVEETPEPSPGAGQVLVDVAYVNITFVDTQIRAGRAPFPVEVPKIPGNGVGGVVAAVGEGVPAGLVGVPVVGSTGGSGGYAERAVVAVDDLFIVPDGLDLADAVALLADGRTASMLVAAADIKPGERVLVEAAAGGVGSVLVQLAHGVGATVVAAAGGARKLELAAELGAAHVVDYTAGDWAEQVRAAVGGVDVVFDGVGGAIALAAFELLARGGRMLSYGLASGQWASISPADAELREVQLVRASAGPEEMRGFTESALRSAAAGRLRAVIGQRLPLERVSEAHEAIQARQTVGKTLLETGESAG